jgi:hypothetical protein
VLDKKRNTLVHLAGWLAPERHLDRAAHAVGDWSLVLAPPTRLRLKRR